MLKLKLKVWKIVSSHQRRATLDSFSLSTMRASRVLRFSFFFSLSSKSNRVPCLPLGDSQEITEHHLDVVQTTFYFFSLSSSLVKGEYRVVKDRQTVALSRESSKSFANNFFSLLLLIMRWKSRGDLHSLICSKIDI